MDGGDGLFQARYLRRTISANIDYQSRRIGQREYFIVLDVFGIQHHPHYFSLVLGDPGAFQQTVADSDVPDVLPQAGPLQVDIDPARLAWSGCAEFMCLPGDVPVQLQRYPRVI